MKKDKFEIQIRFGNFWISQKDLPKNNSFLRETMANILCCDPNITASKKALLQLVEATANEIMQSFLKGKISKKELYVRGLEDDAIKYINR